MYSLLTTNPDPTIPIVSATYQVKQSEFIAYLYTFSDIAHTSNMETRQTLDSILANLHNEHKKAAHFTLASRMINANRQIVESSSDDKEPKGSAGMPILSVLRGEQLIDVLCVCVRYFGGIKLGIGGLVRAYTQASLKAITQAKENGFLESYNFKETIIITDSITQYNRIAHYANIHHIKIVQREFLGETFKLILQGQPQNIQNFLTSIKKY
ncbi:hypothetical protein CQA66_05525 [Helicobacter aurati]|uniref:Impact N-terminal domain-containing protein n=1 Tax=Helicobacter aurati TaxID=137778 RepID=A0A3D8J442_9HELI|nr:YigZ family protein [Helicobacter aurati]RDU71925.1 hypothetical protein CQA66_05525 [Helicobacter aurati]